jgi:hypothetical protein
MMRTRGIVALCGDWTFADPVPVRLPGLFVGGIEDCGAMDVVGRGSVMGSTKIGSKLRNVHLECCQ